MKTGISPSAFHGKLTEREIYRMIASSGFDCVDMDLHVYLYPENTPLRIASRDKFVKKLRSYLDEFGLSVYQCHSFIGLEGVTDGTTYKHPDMELAKCNFEAAAALSAQYIVYHPVFPNVRVDSEDFRKRIMEHNVRFFRALIPVAEHYGVKIAIENTFHHTRLQQLGDPDFPFIHPEDMIEICDTLASPWACICFDTGHALVEGEDLGMFVRALGSRLKVLHIHDNFGQISPIYSDLHMPPMFGTGDMYGLCRALAQTGYDGVYSFELASKYGLAMEPEMTEIFMNFCGMLAAYFASLSEKQCGN